MADNKLKLMTYNIGGGRKDLGSRFNSILHIIKNEAPDLLAIQEAVILNTLDGEQIDQPKTISAVGESTKYSFFGPTLSMQENFDTRKELFIHGIFNDWENWQQGNALFSRFARLKGLATIKNRALHTIYRYSKSHITAIVKRILEIS